MIIEINTQILLDNQITAHQYLIAKMIYDRNFEYLQTYIDTSGGIRDEDLDALLKAKLLYNHNSEDSFYLTRLEPRPRLTSLLSSGDFFDELVDKYPISVTRQDGEKDYLRTDLKRCRVLYNKKTNKSRLKHEHILNCLNVELTERKKNGKLKYMVRLPRWILEESWHTYEGALQKQFNETEQIGYGQEII